MVKYIIKRLLLLIPIILGVSAIIFTLKTLTPGDPARQILGNDATEEQIQAKRDELGLNDPAIVQYFRYIGGIAHGDFGKSYRTGEPVISEILPRLGTSAIITLGAVAIGAFVGVLLGILSALKKYTWVDSLVLVISMFFQSVPEFVVALVLIMIFAVNLHVLPATGIDSIKGYILPMATIGLASVANYTRITRSSMLEVLSSDYIRTARAKGVSHFSATYKHALRNAVLPSITVAGLDFSLLVGGSVAIETVFAIPGVGRLMIDSIKLHDTPTVIGCMVFVSVMVSIINLLVDILYGLIDPRIKAQYLKGNNKKKKKSKKEERKPGKANLETLS